EFELRALGAERVILRMEERVGADLVPLGHHAPHDAGILHDVAADDEEGGRDAVRLEHVEDGAGEVRVRPVVEGQRNDLSRGMAVAFNRDGTGYSVIDEAIDETRA